MRALQTHLLIVIFTLATTCPAWAGIDPANDHLIGVISTGLEHAFAIDSQRLRLEKAHNTRWISYTALLPSLNLSSLRTYAGTDQYDINGVKSYNEGITDQLRLSANWTLWDGYQSVTAVRVADKTLQSERVNSGIQIEQYVVKLLSAYFNYELLLSQRDILSSQVEQSRITNDESQALVQAGAKTRLDAMDSDIQLANDERNLFELDNGIVSAERALRVLVNVEALRDIPRLDLLNFEPYYMRNFDDVLESARQSVSKTLQDTYPDLKKQRIDLEAQQLGLTYKKLNYWPKTSVVLMHDLNLDSYQSQNPVNGQRLPVQNYSIGLSFSWTFWDWLATPYDIQNSQKDYDIALNTYRDNRNSTQQDVTDTIAQLDILKRTIESSRQVVRKAEAQLQYSQEMYRLGRITLLTMQQSTSRVFEARNALATRLVSRYALAAKLLYGTGHSLLPQGVGAAWLQ